MKVALSCPILLRTSALKRVFLKYLTLRNFLSVAVVVIAGLWAGFTFYTSDKNLQLELKQKDVESLSRDKKQLEDDAAHWQRETEQYRKEADEARRQKAESDGKLQGLIATETSERKELDAARAQIRDLNKTVQTQANAAAK